MAEKTIDELCNDRLLQRYAKDGLSVDLARPNVVPTLLLAERTRLNLVIPALTETFLQFAGPSTAIRFVKTLSRRFDAVRIVVTLQTETEFSSESWPGWSINDGGALQSITFLGDQDASLSITPDDYFIATAWATALLVRGVLKQQAEFFHIPPRRFVYFIQEYEAGYYPFSARYDYARSTYEDAGDIIALFNSTQLATYFHDQNLKFSQKHIFEPKLSPDVHKVYKQTRNQNKERILFVYGRPSMARNDFELVRAALKAWAESYPSCHEWEVVSAGLQHDDIWLNPRISLKSAGTLSLEDYARLLSRTWVGLALMFSPHPSFPPLELSEFGCWVVTNSFANKDLSCLSPNIISLKHPAPDDLARWIAWCCNQFKTGQSAVCKDIKPVFPCCDAEEFPFADELSDSWITKSISHAKPLK